MAVSPRGSHSSVSLIQLHPPPPVQVPTPHLSLIPRVAGESLTLALSLPLFSKCHASRESFCKSDSSAPEADETPGRRGKGRVSPGALVAAAAAARTGRNCYVRGTFTVTVPYKLSWAEWVARDTLHVSGLYKYLDALLCTYNAPAFHRRRFQASRHRYQDSGLLCTYQCDYVRLAYYTWPAPVTQSVSSGQNLKVQGAFSRCNL